MSKKQQKRPVQKKRVKAVKKGTRKSIEKLSILDKLDNFSGKYENYILYIGLGLSALLMLFLFDIKVSRGGDDAVYIIRALDFVKDFRYPSFQGPLYPLILSPFLALFGLKLFILKFVSFIFLLLSFYFFFQVFKNQTPKSLLAFSFLIFSLDAYLLYYGYQTYSEAFFMFLQAMLFYVLIRKYIESQSEKISIKSHILLGFVLFLIAITKNIGMLVFLAVIIYFISQKQWKNTVLPTGFFISFEFLWQLIKRMVWSAKELQLSSQASTLFLKHPYDPTKGKEDFVGFIMRFLNNSNLYLSKHLFTHLGFRPEITTTSTILTLLIYTLFFIALYFAFRKNKALLFTGIYLSVILGASFFALQTIWDSRRLMTPYYPLMLIFLLSAFYYPFKERKLKKWAFIYPLIVFIIGFATIRKTLIQVAANAPNLRHSLKGDMLYGLTPDWKNFIRMSKWAAENTPKNEMIASRKPSISYVYTGRRFSGIYKVPVLPLDSMEDKCKQLKYPFLIMDTEQWQKHSELQNYYMQIQAFNIGYITEFWTPKGESMARESQIFEVYEMPDSAKAYFNFIQPNKVHFYTNFTDFEAERKLAADKMPDWKVHYIVTDPDMLFQDLVKKNIHYVIMASLRKFEQRKSKYTINTIRRYLFYIQRRYPGRLEQVKKIGNDEVAYLFKIRY